MSSPESDNRRRCRPNLAQRVARRESRKLRARRERHRFIWSALGASGLVGWSIAVPTILGLAAGMWIDATWPSRFSWTLMLLIAGVIVGCLNAWYWVSQERRDIERDGNGNQYS